MNEIIVIGSMNMDLVVNTDRYPRKGETVLGNEFNQIPGGKGANQALAAGKLGADVGFIGVCGNDNYGDILLSTLKEGGVEISRVKKVEGNTGIAAITIESDGDNRIIVVPGANYSLTPEIIANNEDIIKQAKVILLQLEIPLNTVEKAVSIAGKYDTQVILDPAPAQNLSESLYNSIDYLLPNEGELKDLFLKRNSSNKLKDSEIVEKLLQLGVKNLVVTRGSDGITVYDKSGLNKYPAVKVDPVDTTAAGDAFAGALALGLQNEWKQEKIYNFANKVAALSVTRMGAQSSLPTLKEVKNFKTN
ncbi:MAG: ribokinase [Bacillota bacterium]